MSRSSRRSRRG